MEVEIDVNLVSRLIGEQFPHWADLPIVPVARQGWDNRSFRLGQGLLARLPSASAYAPQVDKEQCWLPRIAPHLPVAVPEPVVRGAPSRDYPWSWSIYRWIGGETATRRAIVDEPLFARDVAAFLKAMHSLDAVDGPRAGAHSFFRGGSLEVYDQQARAAIARLGDDRMRSAAQTIWETALGSEWSDRPLWVHGDLAAGNLLVSHGRLCGVIDFGCLSVGDPACDLTLAWTFLGDQGRATFRDGIGLDDATWERARGWALWKAAILASGLVEGPPGERERAEDVLRNLLMPCR